MYPDSGVFAAGALLVVAVPEAEDDEIAAALTAALTHAAGRRRQLLVLDLRWVRRPAVATWWLDHVRPHPAPGRPRTIRVVAINAPDSLPGDATGCVHHRGDPHPPCDLVSAAYRQLLVAPRSR